MSLDSLHCKVSLKSNKLKYLLISKNNRLKNSDTNSSKFVIQVAVHTLIASLCYAHLSLALQQSTSASTTAPTTTTTTSSPTTLAETLLKTKEDSSPELPTAGNDDSKPASVFATSADFVDHTESPSLLYDNSDNNSNKTIEKIELSTLNSLPHYNANNTNHTSSDELNSSIFTSLNETLTSGSKDINESSDKANEDNSNNTTISPNNDKLNNDDTIIDNDEDDDSDEELNEQQLNSFRNPQNVSHYMDYIESLFADMQAQLKDLLEPHVPQLLRSSSLVQLSSSCSYDVLKFALALRGFEPWALRIIDSSGKFPEGILEGSFTALGSYDQCINTKFGIKDHPFKINPNYPDPPPSEPTSSQPSTTLDEESEDSSSESISNEPDAQKTLTRGKYCMLTVSPFMPPKPPTDKVEREFLEEADRRNYSRAQQFSRLSAMFYYMKFRIGVCIPSTCSTIDTQSIANSLSNVLRLNVSIPHCSSAVESTPLTKTQLFSGLSLAAAVGLVFVVTLIHICARSLKKLSQDSKIALDAIKTTIPSSRKKSKYCINFDNRQQHQQQQQFNSLGPFNNNASKLCASSITANSTTSLQRSTCSSNYDENNCCYSDFSQTSTDSQQNESERNSFNYDNYDVNYDKCLVNKTSSKDFFASGNRFWLSFSALTNYKLYFSTSKRINFTSTATPTTTATIKTAAKFSTSTNNQQPTTIFESSQSNCIDYYLSQQKQQQIQQSVNAPENQPPIIACLNGIRVISLFWVIIANSYITLDPRATRNLTKSREAPKDFVFQIIVQASLAIETFFFLSGLLLAASFERKFALKYVNNAKIQTNFGCIKQWLAFYIHRYVRITPATMLVIAMSLFMARYGDGPLWDEATAAPIDNCARNWWRHALHIANWIDTRQMCFVHYWYISADMQLFVATLPLLYLLSEKTNNESKTRFQVRRILGFILVLLASFGSLVFLFATTFKRNLSPTLLFYNSDPESRREFANTVMTKPQTHILPYFVGVLLGRLLFKQTYKTNDNSFRLTDDIHSQQHCNGNKKNKSTTECQTSPRRALIYSSSLIRWFAFLIAIMVALVEIFLPYRWNNAGLSSKTTTAIYAALFRLGWALVLAWIVVLCGHEIGPKCLIDHHQNNIYQSFDDKRRRSKHQHQMVCYCSNGGNSINRLLGLNIFQFLSKLSFVAFLIHLPLMSVFVAQTRGLFAFTHMLVIHLALSYLVMTLALSFVLVHVFEFPFITLEKFIINFIFKSGTCQQITSMTSANVKSERKDILNHNPNKNKKTSTCFVNISKNGN